MTNSAMATEPQQPAEQPVIPVMPDQRESDKRGNTPPLKTR